MTAREFWGVVGEHLKSWGRFVLEYLVAPGVALLLVVVAVVLFSMGYKELQVGGLLGWLLNRKQDHLPTANTIPPIRKGSDGKPLPQEVPDTHGHTQIDVRPIKEPGLFSDPTTVQYTPSNSKEVVTVRLPDGVRNTDVKEVVVLRPDVVAVTVHDTSKITHKDVNDVLSRYQK